MNHVSRILSKLVIVLTLLSALTVTRAHADEQDAIDYRQHIMKAIDAQTAAVGKILSFAIPEDQLVSHLETIAIMAETGLKSFEANVQGGDSLPAVWEKWDDFSELMNDFVQRTASVAKQAKEGGREAIMADVVAALSKSCRNCHEVYRKE